MPDHQANPATGEIIDVSNLGDRALLEAVYHQNNDILAAFVDALKAIHAVQSVVCEVLAAAKGEHKPQDGKSMKDEMKEFLAVQRALVGAVERVPAEVGDVVEGRLETTLLRVVGDSAAAQ